MFVICTCLSIVAAISVLSGCVTNGSTSSAVLDITGTPTTPTPFPQVSSGNNQTALHPINLTVNSAQKIQLIRGNSQGAGVWLVIDISVKNSGFENGYRLSTNNIVLIDQYKDQVFSPTNKPVMVANLWTNEIIPLNMTKEGEIVFIVNASPDTYLLIINDDTGIPLEKREITTVRIRDYSPRISEGNRELIGSENLSFVVNRLTTPQKTLSFMREAFTYDMHGVWTSYTPEEFLVKKKGDCKDYATFFSYVLARHGYYAEIVSLRFQDKYGHVVSIFRDDDGQLKYMSIDKLNGFRTVDSVDDLVEQEKKRLGKTYLNVTVLPAGSVDCCPWCT